VKNSGMSLITTIARWIRGVARRYRSPRTLSHNLVLRVEQASELGGVALQLARLGRTRFQDTLRRLRELYELSTPALYLQLVTTGQPCRVVLVPWDRGQVSFSGRGWYVLAGADATIAGTDGEAAAAALRMPMLYSHAPDHALFAVSIEQPGESEIRGYFPRYVTHVTIVADGREVAEASRLLHEQGARVFRVNGRAA
jgi:hypothetical protein